MLQNSNGYLECSQFLVIIMLKWVWTHNFTYWTYYKISKKGLIRRDGFFNCFNYWTDTKMPMKVIWDIKHNNVMITYTDHPVKPQLYLKLPLCPTLIPWQGYYESHHLSILCFCGKQTLLLFKKLSIFSQAYWLFVILFL